MKNFITRYRFKRTTKQRLKAYRKYCDNPYGSTIRNQSYYE